MRTCKCGAKATRRIRVALTSARGVGWRQGPPQCGRCADKAALEAMTHTDVRNVESEPWVQSTVRLMVDPREFNRRGFLK